MAAKQGDTVQIEYTGTLDDGSVFDASEKHGKPLEFTLGQKQVIPGFEKAVEGMEVGQEKTVRIEPKDAYGERNDQLVQKVPKAQIPPEMKLVVGMTLGLQTPQGPIPANITAIGDETVTIDLNSPLAGKSLTFKIKLVKIN
jgi:peptidylprolyl isomerase